MGHGYLSYYSIHFCACLKISIVIHLKTVYFLLEQSSPETQYESISSSGLSLLYGPILTPIHDYWKNHSIDYMDLCQQSDVCTFQYAMFVISFQGASIF